MHLFQIFWCEQGIPIDRFAQAAAQEGREFAGGNTRPRLRGREGFLAENGAGRALVPGPAERSSRATTLFMKIPRREVTDSGRSSLSAGLARIRSMKWIPSTSWRISVGVIDATTSGPNISRLSVRWTSSTSIPRVAAARPG